MARGSRPAPRAPDRVCVTSEDLSSVTAGGAMRRAHRRPWALAAGPSALTAPCFGCPGRCVPIPGRAGGRGLLQPPERGREDAGPRVRDA